MSKYLLEILDQGVLSFYTGNLTQDQINKLVKEQQEEQLANNIH